MLCVHSLLFSRRCFLITVLLSSLVVFPCFRFSPPKRFGVYLICMYFAFMVCSVMGELGVFGGGWSASS